MSTSLPRRLTAAGLALATMVGLTACSSDSPADNDGSAEQSTEQAAEQSAPEDAAFPRTIDTLDGAGNPTEVEIPEQPERIVSGAVSLTGALLSLDAPVVASSGGNPKAPMFDDETGFGLAWNDLAEEKGVEATYTIGSADAEAILAQEPDLVVLSSVGADAGGEIYDQLKDVVPVQVVDYSDQSWQETTREVAEAAGLEEGADEVIANYEESVSQAKGTLDIEGPVNLIALSQEGGVNFFTEESAQGQVLTELGIELAVPSDDLVGTTEQGGGRGDIKAVSVENVPLALDGETVFVMDIDPGTPADEQVRTNPALAETPAVANDRVERLDGQFFRLDAIAAQALVDHLVETYGA
ncbi:Fe2+-enterobactin ABC transporter substrate-binding protein [Corynebacterium yudongzhengii]|uniref:Fe2+-enterobactin ABC transporter substrate-binding protein n=1 Tax=Corynebacterium yudongzhengii TaxID=2080740 RepID=A0A2U1T9W3_9CORY|nr:Fe2+-enterobactin ABC transporter substrate-binding protein [Corynebacterium yudongzhengii]AWB81250.1 Fe2+-enterobactin ABC transporter substrate-binding protein [Corynebacterium yudongzhengii]PWC02789.1 Fe2+-enterobactin ABC transporter substrate-binding protein [Corynebacterium yudongzhengii]